MKKITIKSYIKLKTIFPRFFTFHFLPRYSTGLHFVTLFTFYLFPPFGGTKGGCQDIHFSQFYSSPLFLNPALTGQFDCRARIGLNYRNQWASIGVPFITQSAYMSGKLGSEKRHSSEWVGLGGLVYNDQAGDGNLRRTQAMACASYHKSLNASKTWIASLGASIGVVNKSVNFNNLIFDSQWNGLEFDRTLPNNEHYAENSFFYVDFNAGWLTTYSFLRRYTIWIGTSMSHINKPRDSFYDENNRLGRKTLIHGGGLFRLSGNMYIKPEFMASTQKLTQEIIFGSHLLYRIKVATAYVGLFSRFHMLRDIIPVIGIEHKNNVLLISYDVNLSRLTPATNFQGGIEISFVTNFLCFIKYKREPGSIECPTWD